jgi:hypothetical protein
MKKKKCLSKFTHDTLMGQTQRGLGKKCERHAPWMLSLKCASALSGSLRSLLAIFHKTVGPSVLEKDLGAPPKVEMKVRRRTQRNCSYTTRTPLPLVQARNNTHPTPLHTTQHTKTEHAIMARRRASPTGAAAVLTVALLASLFTTTTHAFLLRPLRAPPLRRLSTTTMAAAATSATLPPSTAIVGAGPTGLFTALVLARRGYQNITVYDRLARPDDPSSPNWGNPYRSYNLGLGARGQIALGAAEVWDSIEPFCAQAIGRKDWTPEQGERPEQIYTERYGGGMGGRRDTREQMDKEEDKILIKKDCI